MFDNLDTDRRPLVLIWEVTQACGLACRHCRADAKPARHPDELSTEEGKRPSTMRRRSGTASSSCSLAAIRSPETTC